MSLLRFLINYFTQKQPPEVFYKKDVNNYAIFTGKHLC